MSETLPRIRAKRAGNRGVMTKLSNEAEALLKAETVDKQRLKIISDSLNDKLKLVKTFDEEILDNCAVDEIENEIEESDEVNSRMEDLLRVIQKATSSKETNAGVSPVPSTTNTSDQKCPVSQPSSTSTAGSSTLNAGNVHFQLPWGTSGYEEIQSLNAPSTSQAGNTSPSGYPGMGTNFSINADPIQSHSSKAKLPKLVLPKFRGDVTQWQNFWDSFNSAIHSNPHLSLIDKFNHLHALLEGQAARAIQGLTRTDANYNSAIEILHKRFGRIQNIISTHMDEMLKIPACVNDKASQLRLVYDKFSVNIRGLESLGVSAD